MARRGINSKQKGDNFERKVAKLLSDRFYSYLKVKKGFIRNFGSGSRFGGRNSHIADMVTEEAKHIGDIIVPMDFKFNIECKSYSTPPSMKSILNQSVLQWDNWIEQAILDNSTSGKEFWVVIAKYNLTPIFCILPNTLEEEFNPVLFYKSTFAVLIEDFLSKPDEFYFIKKY